MPFSDDYPKRPAIGEALDELDEAWDLDGEELQHIAQLMNDVHNAAAAPAPRTTRCSFCKKDHRARELLQARLEVWADDALILAGECPNHPKATLYIAIDEPDDLPGGWVPPNLEKYK